MADDNRESCGTIIGLLFFVIVGYFWALDLLKDANGLHHWWHYLLALPLGPILIWLVSGYGIAFIFQWLLIPGGGILLMIWLLRKGFYGWTSGAGAGYLILGGVCAFFAKREESRPWAINSLSAYIVGLVMIVAGIIARFF